MRISDWSSDVCSSDLPPGAARRDAPQRRGRSRMMEKLYLVARIADPRVALRSRGIHSVVTVGTPVEVPGAPPHVAGLFAPRSRVFPLIDPHFALGLSPASVVPCPRVPVVAAASHAYALVPAQLRAVRIIPAPDNGT